MPERGLRDVSDLADDPSEHARHWPLDPAVAMLNHGSFGACPKLVLRRQDALRRQMERQPVEFLFRRMQPLLDRSRRALAELIGAEPGGLVFVNNATAAINAVLRSLRFAAGDELLVTNHSYNACSNAMDYVARECGANVTTVKIRLPVESAAQVVDAVVAGVTPRTRLALVDHVTSPTAIVFPIEEIVDALSRRGVETLVDGAHAPGMVPLDVGRIAAAYYAGNCHKWLCSPKGAGFLYVRPDRRELIQPTVISHGYNTPRPGHTRLEDLFDWTGTDDPTAWLCVEDAIRFVGSLVPGGLPALADRNRRLALWARDMLSHELGFRPVCPDEMIGSMAALEMPDDDDPAGAMDRTTAVTPVHRLNTQLLRRHAVEVPIYHWPAPPRKLLRISAQAYNCPAQYRRLAEALRQVPLG
jgi:isopenicillin-N epimerase